MRLHGVDIPEAPIAQACRRAGIRRLWLFGSILRPDFRGDSDIDVLVESDPDEPPGLFVLGGLASDLSELLHREVHVTTLGGVPADLRPVILADARLQYAA